MNKREKARSKLVKTHGNTTELLELEEKLLHKMTFLVQPPINIPGIGVIRFGWNTEICLVIGDEFPKFILAVCLICQNRCSFEVYLAKQLLGNCDIRGIACRQ